MAKAKSKARAKTSRAPGASSRSRSSGKQQSALYRGGSLAQRTAADKSGPEGDAPDGEITTAAPPFTREAGRTASPSFDEQPVSGKQKDQETAKQPRGQKVAAGPAPKDEDREHKKATKAEDLEPGSSIDIISTNEVRIHSAIAGGSRRTFVGRTIAEALARRNEFLSGELDKHFLPGVIPQGEEKKSFDSQLKQAEKESHQRATEDAKARKAEVAE